MKVLAESRGIVQALLLRAEQQRGRTGAQLRPQLCQTFGIRVQLGEIAPAKLVPLRGIVLIPAPQVRRGSDRPGPEVELRDFLGEAPRLQTIDQDAAPV